MSVFNVQPQAQKDHNSNEIFDMGAAQCAAPMTKFALLIGSFCAIYPAMEIDVCSKLQGQDGGKVARVIVSHV